MLSGDVPLVDPALLAELVAARRDSDAALALVSVEVEEPAASGASSAATTAASSRIVEARDASADELDIDEINAGLYAFDVRLAARPHRRRHAVARRRASST